MAKGYKHGAGGGSIGLNFDVVAYATEEELNAATPKVNTIGVITSNEITAWEFSATEPSAPLEGMVWIQTGTSSTVEFNALKKNGIQVYPLSAKQYVSSAWVDVTAKSFQNGVLVDWWDGTLYDAGNEFVDITGGWKAYALRINGNVSASSIAPTLTKNADSMVIKPGVSASGTTSTGGIVRTENKIDLTDFSSLEFTGYLYNVEPSNAYVQLCIWSDIGDMFTKNVVAQITGKKDKTVKTYEPISLVGISGRHYIGFSVYESLTGNEILVQELILKK